VTQDQTTTDTAVRQAILDKLGMAGSSPAYFAVQATASAVLHAAEEVAGELLAAKDAAHRLERESREQAWEALERIILALGDDLESVEFSAVPSLVEDALGRASAELDSMRAELASLREKAVSEDSEDAKRRAMDDYRRTVLGALSAVPDRYRNPYKILDRLWDAGWRPRESWSAVPAGSETAEYGRERWRASRRAVLRGILADIDNGMSLFQLRAAIAAALGEPGSVRPAPGETTEAGQ
jgi:hypothetical protein